MAPARKNETLFVEIAGLQGRVQQLAEECQQIDQWLSADRAFLTLVQAHDEQIRSLLTAASPLDPQVCSVLNELAIIGQEQIFLLNQTMQREARTRSRLEDERKQAQRAIALLASFAG